MKANAALRMDGAVHPLHDSGRDWPESNCYVDLWIELLHACGLEVEAMLGFTVAIDFEHDQWTFYKPRPGELEQLYGIEVEELNLWRELEAHLVEQVAHGRVPLVEVDAFHLPDTAGRDYREGHTKTTIAVQAIDVEQQRLHYLHNRGAWSLESEDYRGLLRLDPRPSPRDLMPFCEIAKLARLVRRPSGALRGIALRLLEGHRDRVPRDNPIERYAEGVTRDLEALFGRADEAFDPYAFASIRQCGSGFAFAADHLRWLGAGEGRDQAQDVGAGSGEWLEAAEAFSAISGQASMLVLKMARIAHSGRLRDLSAAFERMAQDWLRGMAALDRALGR